MKVIALRGEPNTGKTHTLRKVHQLMLKMGFQQVPGTYEDHGNGDFLDVLEFNGRRVGIVSQGDYAKNHKTALSVGALLGRLQEMGCEIAICACTIGESKGRIQEAINTYTEHVYIEKQKANSPDDYEEVNTQDAKIILSILMEMLG